VVDELVDRPVVSFVLPAYNEGELSRAVAH